MKYRWFRWWALLTIPFILSPFVVVGMLFVEAVSDAPERILTSIPVVIFSCILSYLCLANLFNSTEIQVDEERVHVEHGPIPWRGTSFRLRDIQEFRDDQIMEGRFTVPGVRIRFIDNSFETLCYATSPGEAEEWAQVLNEHLFLLKRGRR